MLNNPSMLLTLAVFCTIFVNICMSFCMTNGSVVLMFIMEFAEVIQTKSRTSYKCHNNKRSY